MKIRIIFAMTISIVMFAVPLVNAEEIKTFFINPYLVDCVGVGPQKCMQIREDQNSEWLNFYDNIQGFTFVEGNSYQITVKITDVENPPADASSKKYELIEIINQESVTRHIPYKNTCAPGFVPLGKICVLNDRCGPGIYPGKVCVMEGIKQPYLRPLQQGNAGISASNVICAEGLKLIFKSHNASPACVKPQSVAPLKERGWQTFMPATACTLEYAPVCGVDGTTYGNECMLNSQSVSLDYVGECRTKITEIDPSVTQQDLRDMVDEWMNNPQEDDRQQRLEIMISYYTFLETGQQLTTDPDGLVLMNQIRKMVSLDLPKEELDQLKQEIRDKLQESIYNPTIMPNDFVIEINNKFFTLVLGTTFIYESQTEDGLERNEVNVTNNTKTVQGVQTVVVWDRVWLDDELIEETFDWYAQDKSGNVWYFGEDSKDYLNGEVISTIGSWEAGVDGAKPGIIMQAKPIIGEPYRQEYYKGIAEDMAQVVGLDESITVPYGTFTGCIKTKDWNPLVPGTEEHKYYCPDIGAVVLELVIEDDEKVELVGIIK